MATVCRELAAKHERLACAEYREAMAGWRSRGTTSRSSTRSATACVR